MVRTLTTTCEGSLKNTCWPYIHYSDVTMGTMVSQMTGLTIVYSTVYSGADKNTPKLRVTGLCAGNSLVTGEFQAKMASNAENVSIWWRHHAMDSSVCACVYGKNRINNLISHKVHAGESSGRWSLIIVITQSKENQYFALILLTYSSENKALWRNHFHRFLCNTITHPCP